MQNMLVVFNTIMKKLKNKIFWKNFLYFFVIFLGASFILSYDPEEGGSFVLLRGYIITSFLCVIYLGYKIARDFMRNEEIEDLIIKKNMTREKFHSKYGEIESIYDK